MVFTTQHGAETTVWSLMDHEPNHYLRYARVTPGSRLTCVEVTCGATPDGGTLVEVCYTLTALSEAGNATIRAFVEGFPAMMDEWRDAILAWEKRRA